MRTINLKMINLKKLTFAAVVAGVMAIGLSNIGTVGAAAPIQLADGSACQNWQPNGATKGRATIKTTLANAEGFGSVEAKISLKLAAGTYDAYVVDLYQPDGSTILGCFGNPQQFTVTKSGTYNVRATQSLYLGYHSIQVVVVPAGAAPSSTVALASAPTPVTISPSL